MESIDPTCPDCHVSLRPAQIRAAGAFSCPKCGVQLQASNRYGRLIALVSFLFSIAASLTLGFRGWQLVCAILVFVALIDILAINLVKYAIPPRIGAALPSKSFHQIAREIMGPTELNLRDKKPR
jgi:predicted RNA-binding Zn-ribbon protein involved in translation (DUF1610 family)